MTPAGNFFEPWDLPRLHPGRSTGSLPLEKEGFLGLPSVQWKYWRFTLIVFLAFSGFSFKTCVWTKSISVLPIVLGKKWHSTFRQPHKSEKKPSVADNCLQLQARAFFNNFWIFQLFSKISQIAFTSAGNVVSGSKLVTRSHVQPATLQKQSMRIQTTGQDLDLILTFRITVSRLTRFFTCNQRLSSTVLSSRAHFFSNGAPNDTNKNSPGQCSPNFSIRCADSSKKWSNSLQYTGYHHFK